MEYFKNRYLIFRSRYILFSTYLKDGKNGNTIENVPNKNVSFEFTSSDNININNINYINIIHI